MSLIQSLSPLFLPCLFCLIALYTCYRQVDFYNAFLQGATQGLQVIFNILPPLIALLTAISMVRASGAMEALTSLAIWESIPVPQELLPLMFLRPLSGSGALAVGAELLEQYGADSLLGRSASVMLGSTETTFYTISLYFGSCGIRKTRYAIPAALCADVAGFFLANWTVQWFFG